MCGIAGVISVGDDLEGTDADLTGRFIQTIKHRGPDSQTVKFFDRCVLGSARLNIIDLSEKGNMPLSNHDGSIWITFNGEVSNFRELSDKYKLQSKYPFKSSTDTEVLVHLYEERGIEFIHELSGMFAFCLYDNRRQKVFLVRDFFGINPVFYTIQHDKIYFASEIKALLNVPDFKKEVNEEAIYHYFTLAYIPHRLTPYTQIRELRCGEMLEADLNEGNYSFRDYHRINYEQHFEISEEEATQKVHELMLDSVRRNLISDAPLGMTLSGGIDTSSMLALAKKLGKSKQMHTFSIKMGESSFDESKYQRIMSQFAGSIHHEVLVGAEEVEQALVEHMAYLDEPSANGACIPSWVLAKEASKYVRVLLSGEGGDEMFNAYDTHKAWKMRELYRNVAPAIARKAVYAFAHLLPTNYSKLSFDFKLKRFTEGAELEAPDAHMYWRHTFKDSDKQKIFRGSGRFKSTAYYFRDLWNSNDFDNGLNKISLIDMRHFFIDDLMVKNDRMFLAHSIESRFPMMDKILFDYVSKLPARYRIKGFKTRWIEKEAMRGWMPDEIVSRPSFGLEMPHSIWLTNKLKPLAEKYLNKKSVEKTGLLVWTEVEKIWLEHLARKRDNGRALWSVMMFIIWFELFIESSDYRKYLRPETKFFTHKNLSPVYET